MDSSRLNIKEKLSFSTTAIGKNLVYFLVATYYMFYLTQVQNLSGVIVGIFFAVTRIFDALNDPVMGTIVDNTRSRLGKYRPWILIGTLLNTAILILMFLPVDTGILFKYFFYLGLYLLWGITYTLMDVPYWSMIPSIALNEEDKNSISSLSQLAAGIGTIIIIALMPRVFKAYGSTMQPKAYLYPSVVIGVLFILMTIITVVFVKEKTQPSKEKVEFKQVFSILYKNDQLMAYIVIMMCILTASTVITSFATYFFSFGLQDYTLEKFSIFTIVAGVSQAAGMISFPFVAKKVSKNKIFYISGISSIAGLVLMLFLTMTKIAANIIILSLCGVIILFGFGWIMVISVAMLADIVDYGEKQNGQRTESIVFSMKTLVQKFAAALASFFIGIAVDLAKITGEEPETFIMTQNADIILKIVMFVVPVILIILALVFYKTKYKLGVKDLINK